MDAYIGEIRLFAGGYNPENWALCDGRQMTISQNQVLFSLIGTTYGGNGTTYFNLPDLRGRAPVGIGQGTGLTMRNLGNQWGAENVTLDSSNLPPHTHPFTVSTGAATNIAPNGALLGAATTTISGTNYNVPYFDDGVSPVVTPVQMNSGSVSSAGYSQAHTNQQPYIVINYIICLVGTYPQRP
ncbi:MAG TPA: tail fiber protein [Candidatus Omnitrophota bacterium]|nr:tail fiber protein [Candidatus Omnitrophota bacterium]